LNIVILDACRHNPYASAFKSPGRGLARMDAPRGTLVAYSTGPGDVAVDGEGGNSPYTLALSQAMKSPDVPAEKMFKLVRDSVMAATKGQQTPWEESSLTGADFYFKIDVSVKVEATTASEAQAPEASVIRADTSALDLAFWQSIQNSTDPAMFEAYLRSHPDGAFTNIATLKRDALRDASKQETQIAAAQRKAAADEKAERRSTELAFWKSVENSDDPANYQAYLQAYPNGQFAALARVRAAKKPPTEVAALAPQQQPVTTPPSASLVPGAGSFDGDWIFEISKSGDSSVGVRVRTKIVNNKLLVRFSEPSFKKGKISGEIDEDGVLTANGYFSKRSGAFLKMNFSAKYLDEAFETRISATRSSSHINYFDFTLTRAAPGSNDDQD